MQSLALLDYAIIFGYLGLSLVMGLLMTSKASAGLDHYILGGRTLPWYLLGVAGMANWFDLTGTMPITSFLYLLGPRGLYIEFRGGAVLILVFMLIYTGKWHRRSGCMTGAEWMTYRFGEGKAAEGVRLLSAVVNILITVMGLAYLIRGVSLFLGMFFPWPPLCTTLVLITLFLLPMQLVIKSYSSFWRTLPLFLVGLTGMYFFWWRPLMSRPANNARAAPASAAFPVLDFDSQ